jgi:hypothetical protein
LAGSPFENADALFDVVQRVLEDIEKPILFVFSFSWMERLEKCLAIKGEDDE